MYSNSDQTIGGLDSKFFFRQLIWGSLISLVFLLVGLQSDHQAANFNVIFIFTLNTLLYPYARFVYGNIVNFLIGTETGLVVSLSTSLLTKLAGIILCWSMGICIAPLGMAYLYYQHRKSNTTVKRPRTKLFNDKK